MRKPLIAALMAAGLTAAAPAQAGWTSWLPWHHDTAPTLRHPVRPTLATPAGTPGGPASAPQQGIVPPSASAATGPHSASGGVQGPKEARQAPPGDLAQRLQARPVVRATEPTTPGAGPSVEQFTAAQSQLLLVNKQIEMAKIDVQLQRARNELKDLKAQAAAMNPAPAHAEAVLEVRPTDPRVLAIQAGPAAPISAQIQLPQGVVLRVHVGDSLPGGWKVTQIQSASVIVSQPGRAPRAYPLLTIPRGSGALVASDLTEGLPRMPPVPDVARSPAEPTPKRLTDIPKFPPPKLLPPPANASAASR